MMLGGRMLAQEVPDSSATVVDSLPSDTTHWGMDAAAADTVELPTRQWPNREEGWPRPGKAARLSLLLPGLGQAYNRSYWKIPLVYGYIGVMGFFAYGEHIGYIEFRDLYSARLNPDVTIISDPYEGVSDDAIRNARNTRRANRDRLIFFAAVGWVLGAVEAYVDAHLKPFDVSDDLSFHLGPAAHQPTAPGQVYSSGLAFTITLEY